MQETQLVNRSGAVRVPMQHEKHADGLSAAQVVVSAEEDAVALAVDPLKPDSSQGGAASAAIPGEEPFPH